MQLLKKTFALISLIAVLMTNTSISVNKHFCGTYLADISLFSDASCEMAHGSCDDERKSKKMDCCSDKTDTHFLDIDLKSESNQNLKFKLYELDRDYALIAVSKKVTQIDFQNNQERGPPLISEVPAYKKFQRLLYYG